MNKIKVFDGLYESLYKKWELYLFRLFQLARWVETHLRVSRISGPDIEEILDPHGCEKSVIRIPPNPFWIRDDDRRVFLMFYETLYCHSLNEKDMRQLFSEIWERIGEMKRFIGITRNTQYIGVNEAEKRLVNEVDVFIKFPSAVSPIHRLVFGNDVDVDTLRSFQRFLKDREPVRGILSYQQY